MPSIFKRPTICFVGTTAPDANSSEPINPVSSAVKLAKIIERLNGFCLFILLMMRAISSVAAVPEALSTAPL